MESIDEEVRITPEVDENHQTDKVARVGIYDFRRSTDAFDPESLPILISFEILEWLR